MFFCPYRLRANQTLRVGVGGGDYVEAFVLRESMTPHYARRRYYVSSHRDLRVEWNRKRGNTESSKGYHVKEQF